jgi:hypothetical protein
MNLERKHLLAIKRGAQPLVQRPRARFDERSFGQNFRLRLESPVAFMSSSFSARRAATGFCWGLFLLLAVAASAQTNYYRTNYSEYAIIGSSPGDQVMPDVAVKTNGGFVVWQDNATDGSGWGVSARRLDSTLSGTLSTFRVNIQGTNDQENPRVALLKKGGAVFVWQGGATVNQHIYARLMSPTNTFLTTNDVLVSTFTNSFQINPAVAVLNNSNVVVVWSSYNQAGSNSLYDVYGQLLTSGGAMIGTNFLINQFTTYNQRTPAVAALTNGGFVVAWVSEQQRAAYNYSGFDNTNGSNPVLVGSPSVDIYARLYNSNAVAQSVEFLVNTSSRPCANPAVAVAANGNYMVAWSEMDTVTTDNSWDVYARKFSGTTGGTTVLVNSTVYGDQFAPRIGAIANDYLITWTSLGQDGSRRGVYGRYVHEDGTLVSDEFRVNTTIAGDQMQPALAADGVEQFLVVWTSYTYSTAGMDLYAQRFINVTAVLEPLDAPYVYAPFVVSNGVYQPQLQVSWPAVLGIPVASYGIYVDGTNAATVTTTTNFWTMTAAYGLKTNSTHSFQVDYVTIDGHRAPISPSSSGTTWIGKNWYGIPYEWMAAYYGGYVSGVYHTNNWPSPSAPPPGTSGSAPTLLQIFLSGGDPFDSTTWLESELTRTSQGLFLVWNTQPGFTYQVQVTTNFSGWSNLGSPRFAAGSTDSIYVGGSSAGYYRIVLLRQ